MRELWRCNQKRSFSRSSAGASQSSSHAPPLLTIPVGRHEVQCHNVTMLQLTPTFHGNAKAGEDTSLRIVVCESLSETLSQCVLLSPLPTMMWTHTRTQALRRDPIPRRRGSSSDEGAQTQDGKEPRRIFNVCKCIVCLKAILSAVCSLRDAATSCLPSPSLDASAHKTPAPPTAHVVYHHSLVEKLRMAAHTSTVPAAKSELHSNASRPLPHPQHSFTASPAAYQSQSKDLPHDYLRGHSAPAAVGSSRSRPGAGTCSGNNGQEATSGRGEQSYQASVGSVPVSRVCSEAEARISCRT